MQISREGYKKRLKLSFALLIFGIVFFSIADIVVISNVINANSDRYDVCIATISDIEVNKVFGIPDSRCSHDVTVNYEIDGVTYESELDFYDSTMKEGTSLLLHYNISSPTSVIQLKASKDRAVVLSVVLVIFFALYVVIIRFLKKEKEDKGNE